MVGCTSTWDASHYMTIWEIPNIAKWSSTSIEAPREKGRLVKKFWLFYRFCKKKKVSISSGKCSLPKTYQAAVLNKLLNQILLRLAASNAPICYYSFIWSCLQSSIFIPCFILDIKCSFNAVHLLLRHLFFGFSLISMIFALPRR